MFIYMNKVLFCSILFCSGSDVFFFFFADSREVSYKTYGRRKKQ